MPKVVSEVDFEAEVLRSELPVLVDFYGDRYASCQQMAPEIAALEQELQGKAVVVRVDIEKSQQLASMLRIQAVPTFIVFAQGRPVAAEQGVVPREKLRAMLDQFLPRAQGALAAPELAAAIQQQMAVAVDTRDAASFGRAHIPGASHMALEEIPTRLAELHMLGSVVLYCRSGDQSKELAEKLAADGVPVPFLEGGFLAWEIEGLPIERE